MRLVDDAAFLRYADAHGWPVCACSECSRALSSRAPTPDRRIAGRIKGRPLCAKCLARPRGR